MDRLLPGYLRQGGSRQTNHHEVRWEQDCLIHLDSRVMNLGAMLVRQSQDGDTAVHVSYFPISKATNMPSHEFPGEGLSLIHI